MLELVGAGDHLLEECGDAELRGDFHGVVPWWPSKTGSLPAWGASKAGSSLVRPQQS